CSSYAWDAHSAQSSQGWLLPVRAQLLPALSAGRAAGADDRHVGVPYRVPLHSARTPIGDRRSMRTRNEDDHDDLDVHDDHDRTSDDRSNDADEDDDSSRPSDLAPEVNLPGARELREAVVNVRRRAPKGE